MAGRIVVADASPLIGLAAAGVFDLLHELFGAVTVTEAVRDEVAAGGDRPGARELSTAIDAGWIEVVPAAESTMDLPELGPGEASSIQVAAQHAPDALLLMDEPLGRARSRAMGIRVTGLAGVLLAARREGLVDRVRPCFETLTKAGFRISDEIVRAVLEEAGES